MLYYDLPERFTMGPWIKFWKHKGLHTGNTKSNYINYINWPSMPMMKVMKKLLFWVFSHLVQPSLLSLKDTNALRWIYLELRTVHSSLCYSSTRETSLSTIIASHEIEFVSLDSILLMNAFGNPETQHKYCSQPVISSWCGRVKFSQHSPSFCASTGLCQ